MNKQTKSLAPPNSIIFVADPSTRYQVPGDTGSTLVTATVSCIAVGTLAEMDGETTISLGGTYPAPDGSLAFEGVLETAGLQVAVIDSERNLHLTMPVKSKATSIKIWVNDSSEPDRIFIQAH